jgi:hypothetical protein
MRFLQKPPSFRALRISAATPSVRGRAHSWRPRPERLKLDTLTAAFCHPRTIAQLCLALFHRRRNRSLERIRLDASITTMEVAALPGSVATFQSPWKADTATILIVDVRSHAADLLYPA